MMALLSALCILFSITITSASEKSTYVFLVENTEGKHVGLGDDLQTFKLVTEGSDWHLYPTISSDGKTIAFVKGADATSLSLTIKNLTTGQSEVLTEPGFVLHPQFARNDGLLFFSIKVGEQNKIAYVDLKDRAAIQYLDEEYSSFFPSPFQSGEVVVYQRNAPKKEIVLYDMLAKTKTVIGNGMSPAVSKDEKYIAYTAQVEGNWDIYVYDRFSKKTIRATNHVSNDFSPTFDRENNLVYTSDRLDAGVFSIYRQEFNHWSQNTGNETLLFSKTGTSLYAPRVSGLRNYQLSTLPAMIGEARSSFGSISYKGKVYVVGGHQGPEHTYPPESFTGRMTVYDTKSGQWKNLAPRLNPSHGFQITAHNDSLYAFGGFAYGENNTPKWKSLDVVERYDIKTDTWEEISRMPRRRSSNALIQLDDKVYLMGGWDATPKFTDDIDGTFHSEIDVFDLKSRKWTTLDYHLPKKRRAFSAFLRENKIYLVGGISEGGSHFSLLDDFTQFDPKAKTFIELPKLPFATFAPAADSIANEAFVFGGMFKTGAWEYEYIPHIYRFDFNLQKWSHTGRYLGQYKGFSQVVNLDENCLGIMGGHSYQSGNDRPLDSFEKFCN